MKNKILSLFMIAFVAINIVSCDDDETTPPSNSGPTTYNSGDVSLEFMNIAGTVALDASGVFFSFPETSERYFDKSDFKSTNDIYDFPNFTYKYTL